MFCSNCGNRILEGARFCTACGNEIALNTISNEAPQRDTTSQNEQKQNNYIEQNCSNEELIRCINEALPIYDKLGNLRQQINNANKKMMQVKNLSSTGMKVGLILGIIGGGIVWIILGALGSQIIEPKSAFSTSAMIVAGVVAYLLIKESTKEKSQIQAEIDLRNKEIEAYFKANDKPELYVLPEKYQYYIAASYIKECLENKRAKDLSEALNLYEEQKHRWEMENYQQMIIQIGIQQANIMRRR